MAHAPSSMTKSYFLYKDIFLISTCSFLYCLIYLIVSPSFPLFSPSFLQLYKILVRNWPWVVNMALSIFQAIGYSTKILLTTSWNHPTSIETTTDQKFSWKQVSSLINYVPKWKLGGKLWRIIGVGVFCYCSSTPPNYSPWFYFQRPFISISIVVFRF